jgi:hypothetical protein
MFHARCFCFGSNEREDRSDNVEIGAQIHGNVGTPRFVSASRFEVKGQLSFNVLAPW